jgi:hypothetical protein
MDSTIQIRVEAMLFICNSFWDSTGTIRTKLLRYALEIGRWALVAYLLFPLRRRMHLPLEFTRTALGIVLFVIFAGKMLYDRVIWKQLTGATRDSGRDLLSMAAIILLISLLVAVTIFFIGLFVVNMYQQAIEPDAEM